MRSTSYFPSTELLLSTLVLYGAIANAQSSDSAQSSGSSDSQSTSKDDTTSKTTSSAKETSSAKASSTSSAKTSTTKAASTTDAASSTTDITSSISSASETDSAITGMPTLTKTTAIPTYPAPSVPPTNNAPFMQHSSAPDGTVFIAVGAILGAFGIAILLWRVIVGFLLHRSVERAAKAQHDANVKTGFPAPPAPFYQYKDHASTMSVGAAGRGVRRTTRGPVLSSTPSASNLFFSPTATVSGNAGGNRNSTFLPSGFYAAGTSSPGANHDHSISLTNLRPDSRGQFANNSRNTLNPSPPDSPSFNARRDISTTTLNMNRPPSQRAPSAYLDDLLADDPSALPPPNMPVSGRGRHSSYGAPDPQNRI